MDYRVKNKAEKGQSLIELLIAIEIFVLTISVMALLFIDIFVTDRVGREKTVASLFAKEGIEAARSIRDNRWEDLTNGEHGIVVSGGHWIFQGSEDDLGSYLSEGTRKVVVEDIGENKKRIVSRVSWELTKLRPQEVSFVSYLTNWGLGSTAGGCEVACQWEGYLGGTCKPERACEDADELGGLGEYECAFNKLCCCQN